MAFRRVLLTSCLTALAIFASVGASALTKEEARTRAASTIGHVEAKLTRGYPKFAQDRGFSVAERIAAGEMLSRTGAYEAAIDELSKVRELRRQGKAPVAPYVDALFLLAEGYFKSEQLLSARRQYRELLDHAKSPAYRPYAGRALSRLVDIALRTHDLASLDDVFERMKDLPASDASGSLTYARAKALFARDEFAAAKRLAKAVPESSKYAHQAQYLLGVILTKEASQNHSLGTPAANPKTAEEVSRAPATDVKLTPRQLEMRARYGAAVRQFRKVTQLPPSNPEQRQVVDLAWMAIGRLAYEADSYLEAAEAYSHVARSSPEFSTMLYELAWVYVRLKDFRRAEKALEVLSITDTDNVELVESTLLRADLMLRGKQFERALSLYERVRGEHEPVRQEIESFLDRTSDPAQFYRMLAVDELELGSDTLPELALDWARLESKGDGTFEVVDDIKRSRSLMRRSRRMVAQLNAVLGTTARPKAAPKAKRKLEYTLAQINQLARARYWLAQGLDDVAEEAESAELRQVRAERRALMRRVELLPISSSDFVRREMAGERQWNQVSQKLHELTLETNRIQALVNGFKRVLRDADANALRVDPAARKRFEEEIRSSEAQIFAYRRAALELEELLEMGRVQIGFGDQRFIEDDRARTRFLQLFSRELALVMEGHDSEDAARYAREAAQLFARATAAEQQLVNRRTKLERSVDTHAGRIQRVVNEEAAKLEAYAAELEALESEATLVLGEAAMKNFAEVAQRLQDVVLRADVGIVEQAWELREQHRRRLQTLQRERSQEERELEEELRDVMGGVQEPP